MSIDALRAVRTFLPDAELIDESDSRAETRVGAYDDQPRLQRTECIEGGVLRARRVPGDPEVRFAAFLDGIQRVRIVTHDHGVPIVLGVVAAVVRVRINRRFTTWGHRTPLVHRRLYVPCAHLRVRPPDLVGGYTIVDTSTDGGQPVLLSRHPAALRATALERIGRDRESLERQLAELWCRTEERPIFIDGSISGSSHAATAACAVGVVKSHTTLYADDAALDVVMGLRRGERTSAFAVRSTTRPEVMSWYLRLRDPRGHDAMFGLVRVEAALCGGDDVTRRADEVSRWVLAEATPVALPDGRWDRMAYGIRDCEEFLRAIAS